MQWEELAKISEDNAQKVKIKWLMHTEKMFHFTRFQGTKKAIGKFFQV